jgi:outer membrane murein-binding lipoprotein Lpp
MILLTQHLSFCSILLLSCFVVGCGQQQETNKLISEINAARAKSQALTKQAESKRAEARKRFDSEERGEYERLMEEAANLYGQISEILNQSADKSEQILKLKNPEWYKEYFTLYSKWTRNLAKLASGAREELLVRKNGAPSEDQLKLWKENISKLSKENEELRKKIAKIESEHGTALIKQE